MNEAQTRLNLIDPALRAAGWTEENDAQILVEQSAVEFAPGKVGRVRGQPLRADYILCCKGRRPPGAPQSIPQRNMRCIAIAGRRGRRPLPAYWISSAAMLHPQPCDNSNSSDVIKGDQ